MAKLYRNIDIQKADMLYSDLWMNSTQAEMDFYPKEFLEIMKENVTKILETQNKKEDILKLKLVK